MADEREMYTPAFDFFEWSLIYQYSGIPISEIPELSIYTYRMLLINVVVSNMRKTEEGRNKLADLYHLNKHSTEFDASSMQKLFQGLQK